MNSSVDEIQRHASYVTFQPFHRIRMCAVARLWVLSSSSRRGFGSGLIECSFAAEVGGDVKLTYAPTGLTYRLKSPLASMQEAGDEAET